MQYNHNNLGEGGNITHQLNITLNVLFLRFGVRNKSINDLLTTTYNLVKIERKKINLDDFNIFLYCFSIQALKTFNINLKVKGVLTFPT